MIVQLHIPLTNSTGGTEKNSHLKNKKTVFRSHNWKNYTIYCHILATKKGNFSITKAALLSPEREQGTYVKHMCHSHRSVGMRVYVSIYVYMLIYIWICTHIKSLDHRKMFHWKQAHGGNRATWNQSFDIPT